MQSLQRFGILFGVTVSVAVSLAACLLPDLAPLEQSPTGDAAVEASGDGGLEADSALAPGPELVVAGAPNQGTVSASVDKRFTLEFQAAGGWQLTQWRNSDQPTTNLGTSILTYTWNIDIAGDDGSNRNAISPTMTIASANRARAIFTTTFDMKPGPDGGLAPRLRVTCRYAIYASGRIGVRSTVGNEDAQIAPVGYFEYAHLRVATLNGWDSADGVDGGITDDTQPYFFMRRSDARANILQTRLGISGDAYERNSLTDRYFAVLPKPTDLAQGASVSREWELRVWPDGLSRTELMARANDVRSAGVESSSGVTGAKFDTSEDAYVATGATGTVTLRLTSGDRFDPSFVIRGWSGPKFRVLRNGVLLASDATPATTRASAAFDPASKELIVSTYEALASSSSSAERTFTFEP